VQLTVAEIYWLAPLTTLIALWIAWSDLKYMRIPNKSVLAVLAVFVVLGLIVLPLDAYLWRLAQFAIVLAIGFAVNALRLVGGGDAKFAAALAPFIAPGDTRLFLLIFGATLIAALITYNIFKRVPAVRRATPDWKSWTAGKDFPMGLALSGSLIIYFALGLFAAP